MSNIASLWDIDRVLNGLPSEAITEAFAKIAANILDVRTAAGAKREITIKIAIVPGSERERAGLMTSVSVKLAPLEAGELVSVGVDRHGQMVMRELLPVLEGQIDIEGNEAAGKIARFPGTSDDASTVY